METHDNTDSLPAPDEPTLANLAREINSGPSRSRQSRIRRRRIREHHRESLQRTAPLPSVIGCVTADLLELEQGLACAVLPRLRGGVATVEEIEELKPTIDMMLRVTKLVTQNCRLEGELASGATAQTSAAPPEPASEEIASCAPTPPDGCESAEESAEGTSEPTDEAAEG